MNKRQYFSFEENSSPSRTLNIRLRNFNNYWMQPRRDDLQIINGDFDFWL